MNNNAQDTNNVEETGVKVLAAMSKTPFKTAFKATLGVAAAQLLIGAIFLGGLVSVFVIGYLILK